jgi:phospholipase D1/2
MLVDGAAFFRAVRQTFLKARRSIFIVGWDIDSRTRLVGESNDPDDGYSPILAELLSELVRTRPDLQIYLLLWDYSMFYAAEREMFPRLSLQWQTPPRVTLCMDNAVPFGSSQHQKLVVVDDVLAFSGGLDLTLRRWDTCEHRPDNPDRIDASERAYPPFHDVQMMVDGRAAQALAVLARRRWCRAHGTVPPLEAFGDPWPESVLPHFTNVEIGIARTQPAFNGQSQVNEVEALFLESIDEAERCIYIENQFVTSLDIAERLARRLRERPGLEVVVVSPRAYSSWVVSHTLGDGRIQFLQILKRAGGDRVRLVYPALENGQCAIDTMVHSKVMVIDDQLLRVGSANLNNRSMGVDTECDLVIEAQSDAERAAISDIRNRLLGEHCGVGPDAVASVLATGDSFVSAVDRLSSNGHRLRPIEDSAPGASGLAGMLKGVADPKQPLTFTRIWDGVRAAGHAVREGTIVIVTVSLIVLLIALAWNLTAVSEIVTRDRVQSLLAATAGTVWAPLWVLVVYLVAGAVAFPVIVLIVATAAIFGPWYGILYATMGVIASALMMYFVGLWLGRDILQRIAGSPCDRVRKEIDKRGVLAVAAIRLVPVAPFTLINLMAGACSIALSDYVAGTLIGMIPGLIAISLLGHQVTVLFTEEFSAANFGVLLFFVLAWIALAWTAQMLINRWRGRAS